MQPSFFKHLRAAGLRDKYDASSGPSAAATHLPRATCRTARARYCRGRRARANTCSLFPSPPAWVSSSSLAPRLSLDPGPGRPGWRALSALLTWAVEM